MNIGINPLPLEFVAVEGGGVRLSDGVTSDIWRHPRLAAAIERFGGGIRVFSKGSRLVVQQPNGQFHTSIPGEELVSSLQRHFAGCHALPRDYRRVVTRGLNW